MMKKWIREYHHILIMCLGFILIGIAAARDLSAAKKNSAAPRILNTITHEGCEYVVSVYGGIVHKQNCNFCCAGEGSKASKLAKVIDDNDGRWPTGLLVDSHIVNGYIKRTER